MKKILCALAACCCAVFMWGSDTQSITFPAYTGPVVDEVNLLNASARQAIETQIRQLEHFQLAIVVLKDTRGLPLEQYSYQLARKWGVGNANTDNGIVFVIVPSARKVRMEVGYGAEGVLTDAQSGIILDNYVIPHFKQGDLSGGIVNGTRALVAHLSGKAPIERGNLINQNKGSSSLENDTPSWLVILATFTFCGYMLAINFLDKKQAQLKKEPFSHA